MPLLSKLGTSFTQIVPLLVDVLVVIFPTSPT